MPNVPHNKTVYFVRYTHPRYMKLSIVTKTEFNIPTLLPSILGQSATFTIPMQIYMDVGVSYFV